MFPPGMNTGLPVEPSANGYVSPGGTIPFPSPDAKYRPVGYWEGEPAGLVWQTVTDDQNVTRRAVWGSPIFNLRPDTDTASSRQNRAFPINRVTGPQLFVFVSGLRSSSHYGMAAYVRVVGHPVDPLKAQAITPDLDVTADISTGLDVAVLSFLPFSGYPMKYWGIGLQFTFGATVPATLPRLTLQAGVY